jgi:hypothetical protein
LETKQIPLHKFGDFDTIIKQALASTDLEFMKIALLAIQRNLENILNNKTREIDRFVQEILSGKEFMSVGILDKEIGKLFRKELSQFIFNFQKENKVNLLPINQIGPDSYFTFLLATHFPALTES